MSIEYRKVDLADVMQWFAKDFSHAKGEVKMLNYYIDSHSEVVIFECMVERAQAEQKQ